MTTGRSAPRRSWPVWLIALSGVEAMAVAVWLLPASVHIVSWPAAGPVRLALLSPTWQLAALMVGAALLAAVLAAWAGRALAPCSLMWLWAVPYLPWLPDRLPLLLVLAGPLRWVVVAAAVCAALARSTRVAGRLTGFFTLSRRAVFAISFVVYLVAGLHSFRSIGLVGDEPHYLIITESLLRDGDLKIENNHRRGDYRSFFSGDLRPDYMQRGQDGAIYSIHAPGLPAMLLPAYAVAGVWGALVLLCAIAAMTALAIFDLAGEVAGRPASVLTWAAICLTVPFVPYAWSVFPEMPGALLVAWAALWVWRPVDRPAFVWMWRGLALGALPWLHTKFVVFLAIFGAALAVRLWRRPRALGAFLAPLAISLAGWLYSFYAIYGVPDPEAPYGAYTRIYVLTRYIPHGLLGIFFDQKFGLLVYSPVYLLSIAGAWLILRRTDSRFLGGSLLVVVAAFVVSTARLYMFWGGSSAPARFLVPILPCLAPMMAVAVSEARSQWSRGLIGLWLTISLAVAVAGIGWPDRLLLFSDPHGRARILEWIQAGSPVAFAAPTFTDPNWPTEVGKLGAWLAAAGAGLFGSVAASRIWRPGACVLAGVASLAFLAAGAVVSARPTREVAGETARRGALDVLWRFDGNRFRTLDYATFGRATPERLRALTTVAAVPPVPTSATTGYSAGPFNLPPGSYEAVVWFTSSGSREGEIVVASTPQPLFARATGALVNPTVIPFDLPLAVRRLTVGVPDPIVAADVSRVEIVPRAVVSPADREPFSVRTIESLPGRAGAYLAYTDDQAYPEGGIFWSRGTAGTTLLVVPAGAARMVLTLSTGPMSGTVRLLVAGTPRTVTMTAGETNSVSFDLPAGQRFVTLAVQSSTMFRPAEVDPVSTDARGLGCQVRISLE